MHFGHKRGIGDGGVQDVVNVNRQDIEEPIVACSGDGVRSVVRLAACVSALCVC